MNVKQALLEKHAEGRYYMSHNGQWIDAGTDALEAQRKRKQRLTLDEYNRLSGANSVKNNGAPLVAGRITVAAAEKYFANSEALLGWRKSRPRLPLRGGSPHQGSQHSSR